ncbi:DNA-processing protein DprA [Rothia nasimurium]|uniref:DNA-processing protein DprA n=1 Tax=Rothia nasimurium TaxID=85336 RepID=UPI001F00D4E3|nr:DNA-processing protein DprA [Rothia nasimurium]
MTHHDPHHDIRRARTEILRITDPEDVATYTLLRLVGPVRAADYLTGRQELTPHLLARHLEEAGAHDVSAAPALASAIGERTQRWKSRRAGISVQQDTALARASGSWLCIPEDPDWPQALNDLAEKTPVGLWGRGDRQLLAQLTTEKSYAVVGSRDVSSYGNSATSHLAGELANRGYTVVSGGAFGVDATAHRAALATATSALPTVALMAGGLDRLYPKPNERLLHEIIERGLLLSEVPLGQNPTRYRFLQRNRLIAALTGASIVIEARWRSGALNTAHHALELGRPLYAVPGPIFSPTSEGCHRLIRDGLAQLVTDARQILDDRTSEIAAEQTSLFAAPSAHQQLLDSLTETQRRVWDVLPLRTPATVEQLSADLALPARTVMIALSQLNRLNLAEQEGMGWRKTKPPAESSGG